jgi:hypothetical protein
VTDDDTPRRDWDETLRRVLAPLRSEAAMFRVLLVVAAGAAALIALVLIVRAVA